MPTDTLYERAKEVFLRVCDASGAERGTLLESLCAGDDALRAEVETLLRYDGEDDGSLGVAAARPPGDRVGRYTIVRTLGAGSMGVVYEATADQPRRTVALKIGRAGVNAASLRHRLTQEVAALARLQHPGIAAVYDSGVDERTGEPYFVMELVRGEPITAYAKAAGLSIEGRVELIAGVCEAVHHAHLRGVIHRDLKPSNILVDGSGRARVLDFGIARITDAGEDAAGRTMPGQVIGTLGYMSPEQASGEPDRVDARADIYALGCIAYELLAGRPPLEMGGRPIHDAVRAIQQDEPTRLGSLDRRLRGDREIIVATAMEKDPARRYQSAEGLASDLRRSLRDEPIVARAPTTLYQIRTFARRRRGLVAASAAVAAVLVGGAVVSTAFAVRADAERVRAERRFDDVRALANTFLFDIHDRIETLPGSIEARRSLIRTGLTYLDSLAAEAADDPALLAELSDAYARIGDIQGNPRRANLGDGPAALASYDRATELQRRVVAADPSTANRLQLVRLHIAIGDTLEATERAGESVERLQMASSMLDGVLEDAPSDADALATLSLAEGRLGGAMRESGRLDEALAHFERALDASRRHAAARPSRDAERAVSVAHNEVGLTLVRMGRNSDALPHYERSMAIRAAAVEDDPGSTRTRRDLALVHHRLADVRQNLGDLDGSLGHHEAAMELLRALHESEPADARARMDLSIAHDKAGAVLAAADRREESLEAFKRGLDLRAGLAADFPDNPFYTLAYSISLEGVANALRLLDRHDAAGEHYLRSIELAEQYNSVQPDDTRMWTSLAVAQRGLGESLLERAEDAGSDALRSEAAGWFRASLATLSRMAAMDMTPVRSNMTAGEINALLARCGPDGGPPGG